MTMSKRGSVNFGMALNTTIGPYLLGNHIFNRSCFIGLAVALRLFSSFVLASLAIGICRATLHPR